MSKRKLAVAGSFYPQNKDEIERYINHFNKVLEDNNILIDTTLNPRALIVPHAGYIYSGFTANFAYRYLPKNIKNIIVIGPSHKFAFKGASVALYENYPTPFGDLDINIELSQKIINKFPFVGFDDKVHCEHSTETQFPFIKNYASDVKVVELVYSDCDFRDIGQVIEYLMEDEDNFVIISTDLSHFYTLDEAKVKDNICLNAIVQKDIKKLENGCEACGKVGVKALLNSISKKNMKIKLLDYRTSADRSKDETRVVGYSSFVIF